MFGKIWALHYVYEFLENNGLIQPEAARLMEENNLYHRNEMIKYMADELWQMSFVFDWPNNHLWAGLKPLFISTLGKSNADAELLITDYLQNSPVPQRITDELNKPKKESIIPPYENQLPFKKPTPDIGRNDPCPCGSGKKYKKCCLN
jgi:hypothetical protein